jgi:phosphatidylethanolamine/phosphatidyl-N-methylethanolamine N-methyltransferase
MAMAAATGADSHNKKYKIVQAARDNCAFFLEFMQYPDKVGSVCPSSPALIEQLLNGADIGDQGLVIDLGAGSGVVSEGMLRCGIQTDRIIAIETLEDFAESFAVRCPGIPLVIGDAGNLKTILDRVAPGRKISAILSSLPFRAMLPTTAGVILDGIHAVLRERGGRLVQYSYAWWLRYPLQNNGFSPVAANIVWRNLPPARVEVYRAAATRPGVKNGWRDGRNLPNRLVGGAVRTFLSAIRLSHKGFGTGRDRLTRLTNKCFPRVGWRRKQKISLRKDQVRH